MSFIDKNRLNAEQFEAVVNTEGPVLILSGAGSGKTHTLTSRMAYLIEKGVKPERILALTFTNKAADEMKSRAAEIGGEGCNDVMACTYHSFCARMLRIYAERAGLSKNFTIISPQDAADIISRLKAEYDMTKLRGFPTSKTVVGIISTCSNRGITLMQALMLEKYEKYASHFISIGKLMDGFRQYKHDHDMLDYDDILLTFYELIRDDYAVRKRISDAYDYIMVDEYQDTNTLQNAIVFLLRDENRNIAVVGDDSQSIYKFRGAEIQNILSFPDNYKDCKVVKLTKNYRSNQYILDLANYVINEHATEGFPKTMTAVHDRGQKPYLIHCASQISEADNVMTIIMTSIKRGIRPEDIAVIYRSSMQVTQLELLLTKHKIPYDKYGGMKYFELSYVLDILAYLRILVNEGDELAWYRVLRLYEGVGSKYAQVMSESAIEKGANLLRENEYRNRAFKHALLDLYDRYQAWKKEEDTKKLVKDIITHYGNTVRNAIMHMKTKDESNREEALMSLEKSLMELSPLPAMAAEAAGIASFLDSISLEQTRKDNEKTGKVVLSTIHSVKGLEFNTVVILDCVDGICPSCLEGDEEDNEELRCFYVAVTRAKEHLYMMYPDTVMKFGKKQMAFLSHYLDAPMYYEERKITQKYW